jgi:perosamine synthetase
VEINLEGDAENGRNARIFYGKQTIEKDPIQAVAEILRSDWLTTGPNMGGLKRMFADFVGAIHALAVNNGTTALYSD